MVHLEELYLAKINDMGWMSRIELDDGIRMTYKYFLDN